MNDEPFVEGKKRIKDTPLVKHTEAVDNLKVMNVELKKDLDDADQEIDELHHRLVTSNIRISRSLFYTGLLILSISVFLIISKLTEVNNSMVAMIANNNAIIEMNNVIIEHKQSLEETEKYRLFLKSEMINTPIK